MLYMVTFTINIPQMLAYIYIYHTWILWVWLYIYIYIHILFRETDDKLTDIYIYGYPAMCSRWDSKMTGRCKSEEFLFTN